MIEFYIGVAIGVAVGITVASFAPMVRDAYVSSWIKLWTFIREPWLSK